MKRSEEAGSPVGIWVSTSNEPMMVAKLGTPHLFFSRFVFKYSDEKCRQSLVCKVGPAFLSLSIMRRYEDILWLKFNIMSTRVLFQAFWIVEVESSTSIGKTEKRGLV
jgi:hypothetical protein